MWNFVDDVVLMCDSAELLLTDAMASWARVVGPYINVEQSDANCLTDSQTHEN